MRLFLKKRADNKTDVVTYATDIKTADSIMKNPDKKKNTNDILPYYA
jgi:hypothetical protein